MLPVVGSMTSSTRSKWRVAVSPATTVTDWVASSYPSSVRVTVCSPAVTSLSVVLVNLPVSAPSSQIEAFVGTEVTSMLPVVTGTSVTMMVFVVLLFPPAFMTVRFTV